MARGEVILEHGSQNYEAIQSFVETSAVLEDINKATIYSYPIPTRRVSVICVRKDGLVLAAVGRWEPLKPNGTKAKTVSLDVMNLLPMEVRAYEDSFKGNATSYRVGNQIVGGVPLRVHGEVIGSVLVELPPIYDLQHALAAAWTNLVASTILTSISALLVGSITGMLVSRWLEKRLGRVSSVVNKWAQGDLSARAPELPGDEIGMLVAKLNGMAHQLDQAMALQQEVAAHEERQRLTRDLHDTVKQQAFATSMLVGATSQLISEGKAEEAMVPLASAAQMTHRMQEDLRNILNHIRAPIKLALPESLRAMVEEWKEQTGIEVSTALDPNVGEILPGFQEQILHIVQEALSNAAKHSRAKHVEISLQKCDQEWTLLVADDGIGMDPVAVRGTGLGMATIRERSEQLMGGRLLVESKPGAGLRLMVKFVEVAK